MCWMFFMPVEWFSLAHLILCFCPLLNICRETIESWVETLKRPCQTQILHFTSEVSVDGVCSLLWLFCLWCKKNVLIYEDEPALLWWIWCEFDLFIGFYVLPCYVFQFFFYCRCWIFFVIFDHLFYLKNKNYYIFCSDLFYY
jgi:hypothetical protein